MRLTTDRFTLRELTKEDASPRYLSWLRDGDTSRFIETSGNVQELVELQQYIQSKVQKDTALLLGVFTKVDNLHIGNVKLEPMYPDKGYAVLGILIGDGSFRGTGVAGEVIVEIAHALGKMKYDVLVLGVNKLNEAAIKAYKKIGFVIHEQKFLNFRDPENNYEMHLKLSASSSAP